jgi:subtilisin family serine protease
MFIEEDRCEEDLGFHRVLRALESLDADLKNLIRGRLTHKGWHELLVETQLTRPELYEKIKKVIQAIERGETEISLSPARPVQEVAWEIAHQIKAEYVCDAGFLSADQGCVLPEKETATVYLNLPGDPITGLPRDLMVMSSNLARDYGGFRKWTFGFDNRVFIADLTPDAIEVLRNSPLVEKVIVEPRAYVLSSEIPTYNPSAEMTCWGVDRVHPSTAWNKGLYGQNVKVCVIDTGIASGHIAFWKDGETNFKGGWNFVSGGENPIDDHDHGTWCAGIIAHKHLGINGRYRGIAPNVDLYAVKVLDAKGSGSFANIAAGVDWARTHGMHIISMSLGGPSGSTSLQQAVDNAWYAGLLVICAAGNNGPGENTVLYPAKYASTVAVAAMDFNENICDFSSRGPEVEVTGPGRSVVGPWAGHAFAAGVVAGSNNLYIVASGTSGACPHVAACAAIMKNWYPAATNSDLRQWLRNHARDI